MRKRSLFEIENEPNLKAFPKLINGMQNFPFLRSLSEFFITRYYSQLFHDSKISFDRIYNSNVKLTVGKYSFSANPIRVYGNNKAYEYSIEIGNYTHIGENLLIINSLTHTPDFVSCQLHDIFIGFTNKTSEVKYENYYNHYNERYGDVEIGNDVWIGSNVTIRGGVKIGNGAIIGTSSNVTKDVADYCVAVGNPAKVIKKRFSEEQIERLSKIAYWNWTERDIVEKLKQFYDINQFINSYGLFES